MTKRRPALGLDGRVGSDAPGGITVRSLAPSVFLPTVLFDVGNGAVAPILALTALDLGASPGMAGVVVALLGIGRLAGNVPASALVTRIGDRWAMTVAAGITAAAMVLSYLATHVLVLAAATLVVGAGNATFGLARHSYVTLAAPASIRATVMSTIGGSHRIGLFLGPFLGAAAIHATSQRAAFLVAVGAAVATVLLLLAVPEPPQAATVAQRPRETVSLAAVWREHGRLLLTLGLAIFAIGAVRAARPAVLPLWADHIGIDATVTSLIFGISAAIDTALFYPAGRAMDRLGRIWVALPSMVVLGGAMMLIPVTGGVVGLTAVAAVMSVGNGIGSGIVMTLGADVAPRDATVRFLAQWRLMGDSGNAAGPLLVSAVATAASLATGIVAAGVVGLLAAAGVARWAPRYSPYATHEMIRASRR
jgi:MFS family permease